MPIAPPEEHVSLRGVEVSVFFLILPPKEPVSFQGSGGKCLLPRHTAGGACVAPGVRRGWEVLVFFLVPPEERALLRISPCDRCLVVFVVF